MTEHVDQTGHRVCWFSARAAGQKKSLTLFLFVLYTLYIFFFLPALSLCLPCSDSAGKSREKVDGEGVART